MGFFSVFIVVLFVSSFEAMVFVSFFILVRLLVLLFFFSFFVSGFGGFLGLDFGEGRSSFFSEVGFFNLLVFCCMSCRVVSFMKRRYLEYSRVGRVGDRKGECGSFVGLVVFLGYGEER